MTKTVGISLGGGGAKGLSHISMLAALDDSGVKPVQISGTSIGAIIGVIYAAGHRADAIKEAITDLTAVPGSIKEAIEAKQIFGWLDFVGVEVGRSSMLRVDNFLDRLGEVVGVETFEELKIPLKVVAADFWGRKEVVFDSGPILPAVAASFSLPGIFKPIVHNGLVLVDGGSVNPVPWDLIQDDCDVCIAVDVLGVRKPTEDLIPSYSEAIFNTFQIAEKAIINEKMRIRSPDIYLEPHIEDVKVLDFHKAEQIFAQAEPERRRLEEELGALLTV